jgi:hypothetical protein
VLPAALAAIARGHLRAGVVTSRVARWDEAAEALLDAGPKVVIVR